MHTRRMVVAVPALCALFVSLWMIPDASASAEARGPAGPLAEMTLGATRIDWQPTGESERLTLTIAGPGDLYIQREIEPGQTSSLSLTDLERERLLDGDYTWELRVISSPGLPPQRPLVESGHFLVRNGSFVAAGKDLAPSPARPSSGLSATRDFVEDGNIVVIGNGCIGDSCTTADDNYSALRLKSAQPNILFDDVDVLSERGSSEAHDWAVVVNPTGAPEFSIADVENAPTITIPFTIAGSAPTSSLYIASNGNLGLGTATPAVRLDLKANSAGNAITRLQNSSSTGYSGIEYLDNNGTVGLFFGLDNANNTTRLNSVANKPIAVLTNSTEQMRITSAGDVGLGTSSPASQLHIRGTDSGFRNKILVENASGTTTPRELLEIRNNGAAAFILKDTSVLQRWGVGTLGSSLVIDNQANAGIEYIFGSTGNLTIAGTLTTGSDRDTKRDIVSVQSDEILAKLMTLPITTWNRKTDAPSVRHMGPMAQDFAATFGLGEDDRHIAILDIAGVSLASIQALNQKVTEKEAEIAELRRENADLAQRIAALEALVLHPEREEAALNPAP